MKFVFGLLHLLISTHQLNFFKIIFIFIIIFSKFLGGHMCPILGPLVPLFWISSDVSSGFQSQSGFCLIHIAEANIKYTLVLHVPTSVQPAWPPALPTHTVTSRGEVAGIHQLSFSGCVYYVHFRNAYKGRTHSSFETQRRRQQEIHNSSTSGLKKGHVSAKKRFQKKNK